MIKVVTLAASILIAGCERPRQEVQPPQKASRCLGLVNGIVTTKYPQVVLLTSSNGGNCTGTFVSTKTLITAKHCLDGTENGGITFNGIPAQRALWAGAIGESEPIVEDLAVVIFATEVSQAVGILSPEPINKGDKIKLVGYGQTDYLNDNEIDGLKRYGENVVTDIADSGTVVVFESPPDISGLKPGQMTMTGRGDSGGPLMNEKGHLIGVVSQGGLVGDTIIETDIHIVSEAAVDLLLKAEDYNAGMSGLAHLAATFGRTSKFAEEDGVDGEADDKNEDGGTDDTPDQCKD